MAIFFDQNQFHLKMKHTSYLFELAAGLYPVHLYFGTNVRTIKDHPLTRLTPYSDDRFSLNDHPLDSLPLECPTFGVYDLRPGMLHILHEDGTHALNLEYESHEIIAGKPPIPGMPGADGNGAETLIVTLRDRLSRIAVDMCYTIWPELDVLARRIRIRNDGQSTVRIEQA
ncbi:MAG: hypothetical protein IJT77_04845, partial [Clostridia bacterium]|nr:hypothetical protein [Clostridia bacterium]